MHLSIKVPKSHELAHLEYLHSPPSSVMDPGVLNGVPKTVLGVCIDFCCGVAPLKSELCRGVFRPPFSGVSTLVSAIIFWAS